MEDLREVLMGVAAGMCTKVCPKFSAFRFIGEGPIVSALETVTERDGLSIRTFLFDAVTGEGVKPYFEVWGGEMKMAGGRHRRVLDIQVGEGGV